MGRALISVNYQMIHVGITNNVSSMEAYYTLLSHVLQGFLYGRFLEDKGYVVDSAWSPSIPPTLIQMSEHIATVHFSYMTVKVAVVCFGLLLAPESIVG
jgi:hypothetical protein